MSNDSSSAHHGNDIAGRWLNAFQTFLLGLLLYLAPPTIAALTLYFVLALAGKSGDMATEWLQNVTFGQFLYVAITEAIVMGVLWWLLRRSRSTFAAVGVKRPKASHLYYVVVGVVLYFSLYFLIAGSIAACQNLSGSDGQGLARVCHVVDFEQEQQIGFNTDISGFNLLLAGVSLIVLPPIVEEILFRGYLYTRLRRTFSIKWAAFLVSLLFGAAHLQLDSGNIPLWIAAIDTFILSVVLVYVREKTGTIWAGVCIHALKNALAFALLFGIFTTRL